MRQSHDGVIYDTATAELLASTDISIDGMRRLYRTAAGRYFVEDIPSIIVGHETVSTIKPLSSVQEAIEAFNTLPERKCDFQAAFPDVDFIDA